MRVDRYDLGLLQTAYDIAGRGWRARFGVGRWVEVLFEDDDDPYFATPAIAGPAEGVCVVGGRDALRRIARDGDGADDEHAAGTGRAPTSFGFSMVPAASLPPETRRMMRRAGLGEPAGGEHPWFSGTSGLGTPRSLNRKERRRLLAILKALVFADRRGELVAARVGCGERTTSLYVSGRPSSPWVDATTTELDADRASDIPF